MVADSRAECIFNGRRTDDSVSNTMFALSRTNSTERLKCCRHLSYPVVILAVGLDKIRELMCKTGD
jgi:hypothetical protein